MQQCFRGHFSSILIFICYVFVYLGTVLQFFFLGIFLKFLEFLGTVLKCFWFLGTVLKYLVFGRAWGNRTLVFSSTATSKPLKSFSTIFTIRINIPPVT
jgi:hypothetical protein